MKHERKARNAQHNHAFDRKEIIRTIRSLHRQSEPLNITAVKRRHPDLIRKVYSIQPFWGWAQAIADAGLSYRDIKIEILNTLHCPYCRKDFYNLSSHLQMAHQLTKEDYWSEYPGRPVLAETLLAARMKSLRRKDVLIPHWEPLWSAEYVLDRISELHNRGFPLNFKFMKKPENGLTTAALKYWNSWDNALENAGLSPQDIRQCERSIHLARSDVVRFLKERQKAGLQVNFAAVRKQSLPLMNAAIRKFGSHRKALKAAGINPDKVRQRRRPYTKSDRRKLLQQIRDVAASPEAIRRRRIRSMRAAYRNAMAKLFYMSWAAAAKAAGVPYRAIHPVDHRKLATRKEIIATLKTRLEKKKSVRLGAVKKEDCRLYRAVLRYWSSNYEYYPLLGLAVQPQYNTRAEVIAAIRKRVRTGLGIQMKELVKARSQGGNFALYKSAMRLFGGHVKALNAAKIPFEIQRPNFRGARYPSPPAIITEIRRRIKKGWSVSSQALVTGPHPYRDHALIECGRKFFQSWRRAVSLAIGKANKVGPKSLKTR